MNAHLSDLVGALQEFQLQELSADWVSAIFDSNFTEIPGVSNEEGGDEEELSEGMGGGGLQIVKSPEFGLHLQRGVEACRKFQDGSNDPSVWLSLTGEELSHRRLTALLCYVMEIGLKRNAAFQQQQNAVVASQLYMALCSISGSQAYHVCNSCLYQKCLDILRMCQRQLINADTDTSITVSSRGRGRGRGGRNQAASRATNRTTSADESNLVQRSGNLNADQIDIVRNAVGDILCSLFRFLNALSLKEDGEAVRLSASLITDFLSFDVGRRNNLRGNVSFVRAMRDKTITEQAFACLQVLSSNKHDKRGRAVIKCLMPKILLLSKNGGAPEKIAAEIVKLRDLVVEFIVQFIQETEDPECFSTVYTLCQHVTVKVADKADYRHKVGQTIAELLLKCPEKTQAKFVKWMKQMTHNPKGATRGFLIDLSVILLKVLENDGLKQDLMGIILDRCFDRTPTVRGRAVAALQGILTDQDTASVLEKFLSPEAVREEESREEEPEESMEEKENRVEECGNEEEIRDEVPKRKTKEKIKSNAPKKLESLLEMLARRSVDEKPMVRKSALMALEAVYSIIPFEQRKGVLQKLKSACSDVGLSVRKQAADSLNKLLHLYPDNEMLQQYWLHGLLPLISDRESSAQDKVADILCSTIFKNLRNQEEALRDMAWSLLITIEGVNELTRYFTRAIIKAVRTGSVNENVLPFVEAETRNPERSAAAWMVLADFSSVYNVSPRSALAAWYTVTDMSSSALSYMGKIFSATAKRIKSDEASELVDDMQRKLDTFELNPENISYVMHAALRLIQVSAESEEEFTQLKAEWCKKLFENCEQHVSELVFCSDSSFQWEEDPVVRRLFTLGVVIQYSPKLITKRTVLIVESLVASEHLHARLASCKSFTQDNSGSILRKPKIPRKIQTIAVITLGKICLLDEDIAKTSVPSMVRELTTNRDAQVRNNIIMTLSDLCVRYTSLVDRHISTLSLSLKDPAVIVRKQTLTLLTNLLKEDFLRWRGILLYRFVSTLLDENEAIRSFAEFCLIHVLLIRFPAMFSHHFLECLYFFNGVKHPSWESKEAAGDDSAMNAALFSLKGQHHRDDRIKLYKFMLKEMPDQDKFTVSSKISGDIIGSTVDGILPLNSETKELLYDCLMCLASEEIKISVHKRQQDYDEEEVEPVQAALVAANTKIVSQALKRATIERIIPNVMSLKMILEKKRSSLMKPLMLYLRELMKDYRAEIDEVLAGNRQVIMEIEFELKRFEKRNEAAAAKENALNQDNGAPQNENAAQPMPQQSPALIASNDPAVPEEAGEPMDTLEGGAQPVPATPAPTALEDVAGEPEEAAEAPATPPRVKQLRPMNFESPRLHRDSILSAATGNTPKRSSAVKRTPKRGQPINVVVDNAMEEEDLQGAMPTRAISTPAHASKLQSDLTFQLGKDFSVIVSPIRGSS